MVVGDAKAFTRPSYDLIVAVNDGVHTSTQQLTIDIVDLSSAVGASFAFRQSAYSVTVVENVTTPSTLLMLHTVGSQLGEHVTYRLLNDARTREHFTLGAVSGELRTTSLPLDREHTPNITLVVQAVDRRLPPRRAQALVVVTVGDVNDCTPVFLRRPYVAVVPMDAKVGDNVTTVLATDEDDGGNGRVAYTLTGSEHFDIDASSGAVRLVRAFRKDMSTPAEYKLTVTADDSGTPRRSASTDVIVKVVNRAMPVFDLAHYAIGVMESAPVNATVTHMHAVSNVGGVVGYAIVAGNEHGQFMIEYINGERTAVASFINTGFTTNGQCKTPIANTHDFFAFTSHFYSTLDFLPVITFTISDSVCTSLLQA